MNYSDLIALKEHISATVLNEGIERPFRLFGTRRARTVRPLRNVHGVGVGRKITKKVEAELTVVRVYVRRKRPLRNIPLRDRIPTHMDGIPTDVIQSPPARFACNPRALHRPVIAGISASHAAAPCGTLACFCRSTRPEDGTDVFALSCNHVFARFDAANVGDPLFQPSRHEASASEQQEAFAVFTRSVPLQVSDNLVDAAIGRVIADYRDEICSIGSINGNVAGHEGMIVLKHGRTSALSTGVIKDASFDHVLEHPVSGAKIKFVKQLRIEPSDSQQPFADEGDSGSLVVRASDHAAVGLLFAKQSATNADGTGSFAVANRFEFVQQQLQVGLLSE